MTLFCSCLGASTSKEELVRGSKKSMIFAFTRMDFKLFTPLATRDIYFQKSGSFFFFFLGLFYK